MFYNAVLKKNEIAAKKTTGCHKQRKKVWIFLLFSFMSVCFFSGIGQAEDDLNVLDAPESSQEGQKQVSSETFSDRVIGSTFKILAKAFVKTVNMNKLKSVNIAKLQKMSDEKFAKKNLKVYEFTKDLPLEIKERYSVSDHMTRQQAIDNINSLEKNDVYALIDKIPNSLIAGKFRQYAYNSRQKIADSNVVNYIKNMWRGFVDKATTDSIKKKA